MKFFYSTYLADNETGDNCLRDLNNDQLPDNLADTDSAPQTAVIFSENLADILSMT